MADRGHELTDEILEGLEERIADEYAIALRDMQKKLEKYLQQFEAEKARQKKLLDDGKITKKEYDEWVYRHTMMGKQWKAMRDVLASDLENASEIALKISRSKMPDVYALNANYSTYQIEHDGKIDTGFTLYNHDTAELLLREEDLQLMPGPSTRRAAEIAADESMQWNRQKIQSAVFQGIVQGESPYDVAKRLRSVATMNYNASVRYARTMTTNAQNAGRYEAFRRADQLGVDLTIEWQATLDGRTRHDHRLMHGQRTTVDKPFHTPDGFTIMWPADCTSGVSKAPQGEIWNCRCTLLSWVKGFEGDTVKYSPKMGNMTFEEWQNEKDTSRVKKTETSQGRNNEERSSARSSIITDQFQKNAVPGEGNFIVPDNYEIGKHKEEISGAKWLFDTFGGDIELIQENPHSQKPSPDYRWRGAFWELKNCTSINAIDQSTKKAIRQIAENPGGIFIKIENESISKDDAKKALLHRLDRSSRGTVEAILLLKDGQYTVIRHQK